MKVGILGTGSVGQTLAQGFLDKGHDVVLGTRDPATKEGLPAPAVTFADAARHGEVLVLCVHGQAAESAVALTGPENLAGKLVLDTTNPLEGGPDGAHRPAGVKDSLLQAVQRAAPKGRFVKAWNCVPGIEMVDPALPGGPGTQFICGDDAAAKQQATGILKEFGWDAVDIGGASMAPYVEGMALAVINHGMRSGEWAWGLKLLR